MTTKDFILPPEPKYLYDEDERCEQPWQMGRVIPVNWNGLHQDDVVYYAAVRSTAFGVKVVATPDFGETFIWGSWDKRLPHISPVNICPTKRAAMLNRALWTWLDKEVEKRK